MILVKKNTKYTVVHEFEEIYSTSKINFLNDTHFPTTIFLYRMFDVDIGVPSIHQTLENQFSNGNS